MRLGIAFAFIWEVLELTQVVNSLLSEHNCTVSALSLIFYEVLKVLVVLFCC